MAERQDIETGELPGCTVCRSTKHFTWNCPKSEESTVEETRTVSYPQEHQDASIADARCFKCDLPGHSIQQCKNARFEEVGKPMQTGGGSEIGTGDTNICTSGSASASVVETISGDGDSDTLHEVCSGNPESRPFITATENLNLLYRTEQDFAILKLATKDNVTLTGHRFILAAKSPVIGKIIEDNVSDDCFNGTIQLGTVNAKPLMIVMHWMYTGAVHQNAADVMEEIVEMCVAFQIPELLQILDENLIKICSTENMFRLFQVAQKNGMKCALGAISDFIKKNNGNVATA